MAQVTVEGLLAQKDEAVQSQIRLTARTFLHGGRSESEIKTNWRGYRELETLRRLAGDDEQLVRQVAIYAVVEPGIEEPQLLALLVLDVLQLKPTIAIGVLAPYLDCDNKLLRGFVRDWFESHASRATGWALGELAANYKDYWDYINRTFNANEKVPSAFVEFMYEQSPKQALFVFLRLDGRDEVIAHMRALREAIDARREGRAIPAMPKQQPINEHRQLSYAAHLVDNAIWLNENKFNLQFQRALPEVNELLATLSQHEQWWVRFYVAQVMRRHRELRQSDVIEKLSRDTEASVSKAAKALMPANRPAK
jgi:hypothetical protein